MPGEYTLRYRRIFNSGAGSGIEFPDICEKIMNIALGFGDKEIEEGAED